MRNTNMLVVADLLSDLVLDENEFCCEFEEYGSDVPICVAVDEISDYHVDTIFEDIAAYLADNVLAVNDTISSLGWDGCGRNLYTATQLTQRQAIFDDVTSHLEDGLKMYALLYYGDHAYADEIPLDLWNAIVAAISSEPSTFGDLTSLIDTYLNK